MFHSLRTSGFALVTKVKVGLPAHMLLAEAGPAESVSTIQEVEILARRWITLEQLEKVGKCQNWGGLYNSTLYFVSYEMVTDDLVLFYTQCSAALYSSVQQPNTCFLSFISLWSYASFMGQCPNLTLIYSWDFSMALYPLVFNLL